MNERDAYALGYYYGRSLGAIDMEEFDRLTNTDRSVLHHAMQEGYDRGLADYVEFSTDLADQSDPANTKEWGIS